MERLTKLEPNVFVEKLDPLSEALQVDELHRLNDDPSLAAYTYIRQECQRCHYAVKGREVRGDFHGMGCSSCHSPYGSEGYYEGRDASIPKNKQRHALVHSIQGTREAKVTVKNVSYHGMPVEICTICHDCGKRINLSLQGPMESPFAAPYSEEGKDQPALYTKHYITMEQYIHNQKGMPCQDCHTSIDVHSDGFLAAANLAPVKIECSHCHWHGRQIALGASAWIQGRVFRKIRQRKTKRSRQGTTPSHLGRHTSRQERQIRFDDSS
jgi:hypothetical protein